jgi:hypothetical protein
MSRLVRIPVSQSSSAVELDDPSQGSYSRNGRPTLAAADGGYLDRVAKYVPGEVLAFFIVNAIQSVADQGTGAAMAGLRRWRWQ